MIYRVMRAPINLFFDVTPIGRILNRFSKDLSVLDSEMCWCLNWTVISFFDMLIIITVAVTAV